MNKSLQITCPNCETEFELSAALTGKIEGELRAELERDISEKESALKEERKLLEQQKKKHDESVASEVEKQLKAVEKRALEKIGDKYEEQVQELKEEIEERKSAEKQMRARELELRKKQRELEEAKEAQELEVQRKLDEERKHIWDAAMKKADQERRLKELEKDKMINDLRESLETMKRKAEQGPVEAQGEVLEQDFESHLRSYFPDDDIQPVAKGMRGADLIQNVRSSRGRPCGSLLWEIKNTKAWSAQWIPKLKADLVDARANIAILASVTLPKEIERFQQVSGVWVCDPLSAVPLASALRQQLIAVDRERSVSVGKSQKKDMLYEYLAGPEFKQKIEGIVDAFTSMQRQLSKERAAMERQWKQREKEIESVMKHTVGLYGDMQGIIGGEIPIVPALELDDGGVKKLPGEAN